MGELKARSIRCVRQQSCRCGFDGGRRGPPGDRFDGGVAGGMDRAVGPCMWWGMASLGRCSRLVWAAPLALRARGSWGSWGSWVEWPRTTRTRPWAVKRTRPMSPGSLGSGPYLWNGRGESNPAKITLDPPPGWKLAKKGVPPLRTKRLNPLAEKIRCPKDYSSVRPARLRK